MVRRAGLAAALLLTASAFAQPRPTPLTRGLADALYCKLTIGCPGFAGTVTSVGNGTIGSLFTATWATATTTPALSFDITNQGTVAQVLHGNAAGHPSFGAVVSADLNVTGTTCSNQFLTVLSSSLAGTCTTVTLAGAQFANQGTATTLLHGAAAGNPSWGSVVSADMNITTTTCTNQFLSAISATGTGTCTTDTLASAQHANQGTTTTVLHGAAAGSPSFGAVVDADLSLTGPALGAPTAATIQISGNAGFGVPPSVTAGTFITTSDSANEVTQFLASNTNAVGTTAQAKMQVAADVASLAITSHGTSRSTTRYGVTIGGYTELDALAGNGLLIGTRGAAPLRIGTNSTAAIVVDTSQGITLPQLALTAGTMTATNTAVSSGTVHRYDWTNAMVTALGASTTGDITVCTLPAKVVVRNVYVVIDTPDTSANALTVAVGRTSAAFIDYVVASDAKASANTVYGATSGTRGTNLTGYDLPSITGTTAIKAHFIKTTTNLSTVVASTGHIYIETTTLP